MYPLDIPLMMPENHIELVPQPWVTTQIAPKMLKIGKTGIFASWCPQKKTWKFKLWPTFEIYPLDISLMMPENYIELVPLPWVTR